MKYEVTKDCIISGNKARAGQVVELSDIDAGKLMGIGRVKPYEESEKPATQDRQVKKTTTRTRKPKAK